MVDHGNLCFHVQPMREFFLNVFMFVGCHDNLRDYNDDDDHDIPFKQRISKANHRW